MAEKPYYITVWSDRVCDDAKRIEDDDTDLPEFCRVENKKALQRQQEGVEAKEWVRYKEEPWLAKTGDANYGPIALPLHEAIASVLYSAVGLRVNEVSLGSRKLEGAASSLGFVPVSLHRFRSGNQRQFYPDDVELTDAFVRDYAIMSAVDAVVGQGDRHKKNYMVLEDKNLFVIDNGRALCFAPNATLNVNELDAIRAGSNRESRPWNEDARSAVRNALWRISDSVLHAAFDAVPRIWGLLHDAQSGPTVTYAAQRLTLAEKASLVRDRLQVAKDWTLQI